MLQEVFWHLIAIKLLLSKDRAPALAKHKIFQSLGSAILGKSLLAKRLNLNKKSFRHTKCIKTNKPGLAIRKALGIHVYYFSSVMYRKSATHFLGRFWTGGGCTGWVGAGRFRLGSRAGLGIPGRIGGVPPYGGPGGPMGAP